MRKALDTLYRGSGILAAVFLAAICLIVLLQVVANIVDVVATWITGHAIGLVIPSYAEFAGFFLAASSFLALAYALRAGAHIRVSLVVQHMTPVQRRISEIWCTGAGAVMAAYFAYFTVNLIAESYRFHDVSPGMVPVPLWMPQVFMALGLIILAIALADCFVDAVRGRKPVYEVDEDPAAASSHE